MDVEPRQGLQPTGDSDLDQGNAGRILERLRHPNNGGWVLKRDGWLEGVKPPLQGFIARRSQRHDEGDGPKGVT